MKILLLGKGGQVGWELQRSLSLLGELVALDFDSGQEPTADYGRLCGDLRDLDGLAATVRRVQPDLIVNAAAHTAVDRAESEPELARLLNASAVGVLASEAETLGAWLLHYSTDYVFDGSGDAARHEDDPTGPLSVYGATKLEGERLLIAQCARHLILRTSWVYAARGGNFAKTMLRLAQERETLSVIDDQFGAPTGAELLADVTAHVLRQAVNTPEPTKLAGVYHTAAAGVTTWHSYAKTVIAHAQSAQSAIKIVAKQINPVATSAYPTPARRPLNSRLDTRKLQTTFGLRLPPWQDGVRRMLTEIL